MYTRLIFVILFICGDSQKLYDSRYDYYDTDHLIENPRLLKKYINCFLNEGPCTPIGKDFKIKDIMMRAVFVLACLVLTVSAVEKYSSKYDNFDVDTLISNDRLLKSYINCFLDKGRCTSEGADFKKHLPEAIETTCGKCSEKQKSNIKTVIKAIQQKHPKQWDELVKKNDPTGKHRDNFDKFIQGS
ncbi:unnamed protein product [Pieris brassicae]|uniref:Chemosensory protein n=1 Tax=Pieris brassicae TaxID=7116 RepID=A0A9P0XD44_PIEBR|nr:unnamed protein product [Pieris brassicae]